MTWTPLCKLSTFKFLLKWCQLCAIIKNLDYATFHNIYVKSSPVKKPPLQRGDFITREDFSRETEMASERINERCSTLFFNIFFWNCQLFLSFCKSSTVTQNTKPVLIVAIILFLPLFISTVLVLCQFGKPGKKSSTYSEIPQHHWCCHSVFAWHA